MGSGCTKKSRRTGRDDGKNERTPSIFVGKTFDPSSFGGRGSLSRGSDDTPGTIMTPEERRQFIENPMVFFLLFSKKYCSALHFES